MRALTLCTAFLLGSLSLAAQSSSVLLQVSTFAGQAGVRGYANGTSTAARFFNPTGIILDKDGNLVVADSSTNTLRKITSAGVVSNFVGAGYDAESDSIISGSTDGIGTAARLYIGSALSNAGPFGEPELVYIGSTSLALDATGNLYFADTLNNTIRKVTPAAAVSTIAGAARTSGSADGAALVARFTIPAGVAMDANGNLYVSDTGNFVIRKITPSGSVSTFAGSARFSGTLDGIGSAARFNGPMSLVCDASGNVIVTDSSNHTIRKITPAGVVTTIAGEAGKAGSSDGVGKSARFNLPSGIAVDKAGNIFIADTGNQTIRMIAPNGTVSTIGGQVMQVGSADGTGTAARFKDPIGLAVDATGALYIADTGNHTIRKATLVSGSSVTGIQVQLAPQKRYVGLGQGVFFSVLATSSSPISYQWLKNGAQIPGATNATFTIGTAQYDDAGFYSVTLSAGTSSLTTPGAELKVFSPTTTIPPVTILTHPEDKTVAAGLTVIFAVDWVSTVYPTFQWRKDGVDIPGATSATYTIASLQTSDAGKYSVLVSVAAGSETSREATLTVTPGAGGVAPTITTQPASQTVTAGTTATFTAAASGTPAPTYQWRKDGTAISGATDAVLSLFNVQTSDAGAYTLVASNASGSVTSNAAALTVNPAVVNVAPAITTQPQGRTVTAPAGTSITVVATGSPAPTYQWYKNGTAIAGATSSALNFAATTTNDSGSYTVQVTNIAGSVTSSPAMLTVNPAVVLWSRIVNLSIRSTAGTGDQALIAGFVVSGGNKPLLVRGIGPTLGMPPYNVGGTLSDPQLAVYSGSSLIASNDNWGSASNAAQIAAKSADLYAFALGPTSKDAALLPTIGEGAYTAQITGAGNTTGIALAEVYDADTALPARLVNVSARTQVGTGDNILVVGFVITGNTSQKVLIRGVGPTLASAFGLSGALADPVLVVYKDQTEIARNDNWGSATNAADVAAASAKVYAFGLASNTSKDAALLLTLQPGNYTAQVSGLGNTTGVGLAEVYEVRD